MGPLLVEPCHSRHIHGAISMELYPWRHTSVRTSTDECMAPYMPILAWPLVWPLALAADSGR